MWYNHKDEEDWKGEECKFWDPEVILGKGSKTAPHWYGAPMHGRKWFHHIE